MILQTPPAPRCMTNDLRKDVVNFRIGNNRRVLLYSTPMLKIASFSRNWQSSPRGFDSLHPLQLAGPEIKRSRGHESRRHHLPDKYLTVREVILQVISFLEDVWQK